MKVRNGLTRVLLMTAMLNAVSPAGPAWAQQSSAAADEATSFRDFSIPALPLSQALLRFSENTGIQLFFDAPLTASLTSQPVVGRYSANSALTAMLEGTGLVHRFVKPHVITLEKSRATGVRQTAPVRVEGANTRSALGTNGSSDITATEGSGSYTSRDLEIGSKTPESLRETPRSVSVVTQERMQDQNLTSLNQVMNQSTGITSVTGAFGDQSPTFYSRGHSISVVQIDGGAPLNVSTYDFRPLFDMAMYDHVEVLRGSAGLLNGFDSTGGSINLVRKRPLDHAQLQVEASLGSWDNRRAMIDGTMPLAFDGRLRGRAVALFQDNDYFYDTAHSRKSNAFLSFEADVTPTTLLGFGGAIANQKMTPFLYGLPRFSNGDDLHLGRDTCLCPSWGRYDFDSNELFLKLDQQIGRASTFKINLTRSSQDADFKYGYVMGPVSPNSGEGATLNGLMGEGQSTQYQLDSNFRGVLELWGREQEVLVGWTRQITTIDGPRNVYDRMYASPRPAVDVFAFDSAGYPEPPATFVSQRYRDYGETQTGGYASVRVRPIDALRVDLGVRYSRYVYDRYYERLNAAGQLLAGSRETYDDDQWSPPYFGISYDISPTLTAYGSYASTYASASSKYLQQSGEPVKPSTGFNWELGVKHSSLDGQLNASLAVYWLEVRNSLVVDESVPFTIDRATGQQCCFIALDERASMSRGVEAEITGQLWKGLQLFAGYTYNDNYSPNGQRFSTYTPKHLFKLWAVLQPGWAQQLKLGLGVNAQTEHYTSGSACTAFVFDELGNESCAPDAQVDYEFTQPSYAVIAARIEYALNSQWEVALNVNNVTDRTYYQTVGTSTFGNWYGEPRAATLTVLGKF
ncbi:TonB-dependent siderophore receptor [Steroidobacter flavus]|uniref:TonB-dependent siderophore receptor n=1 Tax=Steroidobacter flavus TaxID=1842136 RepID=A0ABV8T1P0_9GAMM